MKGLKKVALASAVAAISAGAQAELKALDDAAMGELTGQAGLTIDIESQLSIGEFAYVDAGAVVFKDIYRGGKDEVDASGNFVSRTLMDNIRLTLDVAGSGESFNYGMSEVRGLAKVTSLAGGATVFEDVYRGNSQDVGLNGEELTVDGTRAAGDGDLVLHFGFTDAWHAGGGFAAYARGVGDAGAGNDTNDTSISSISWEDARDVVSKAVDFQFEIGQIALADSGYEGNDASGNLRLGSEVIAKTDHATGLDEDAAGASTTTLISDLKMSGYLGPMDIIIENRGNGFSTKDENLALLQDQTAVADASGNYAGVGGADSKIIWDSYVKVTDLDLYIDIAGVQLTDIKIHNERGDLSGLNYSAQLDASGNVDVTTYAASSSFGFAHSKREIYAVKDAVIHVENYLYAMIGTAQGGGDPTTVDAAVAYDDGIAINTQFKGDIDIGALSFGDTGKSIGSLYFTDIQSTSNMTISAH
jgi:hypothetical protein